MEQHKITADGTEFTVTVIQDAPRGWIVFLGGWEDLLTNYVRFGENGFDILDKDEDHLHTVTGPGRAAAALAYILDSFRATIEDSDGYFTDPVAMAIRDIAPLPAPVDVVAATSCNCRNQSSLCDHCLKTELARIDAGESADAEAEAVERYRGRVLIQLGEGWNLDQTPDEDGFVVANKTGKRAHVRVMTHCVSIIVETPGSEDPENLDLVRDRANPARVARIIAAFTA